MRKRARLTAGLALALAVVVVTTIAAATAATGGSSQTGFKTAKPPYLVPTAPGVLVDPIISTGDIVGSPTTGYQMSGIPDGLGAYRSGGGGDDDDDDGGGSRGNVVVVMNHELGRSFPNNPPGVDTRITRLEIDRKNHSVLDAEYLFHGNEGFERFCSATLMLIGGQPLYFTGEEAVKTRPGDPPQPPGPAHDGSSIVMDPETGMWVETVHFGHFQHENVVPLRLKKWVFLSSEDDFRAPNATPPWEPSFLYAYIADDFNRALRGRDGSLYVWKADNAAKNQTSAVLKGESIPGRFIPIPQSENTSAAALKNASKMRDAFEFDRLEDIAVRPDIRGRTYIADTGKPPFTARGRVYQFDVNPRDPTQATLKMILNADPPDNDDLYNPDNMDASERVLMIQEDRESAFRGGPSPPNPPVADAGYSRVMEYNFRTGTLRSVARVNTPAPIRPGNWESSGIIKAFDTLGRNWWLLDVQAHGATAPQPGPSAPGHEPVPSTTVMGEDGQLLAMFVPGSGSGSGDDDDDDD
jgi:hypothetical protein